MALRLRWVLGTAVTFSGLAAGMLVACSGDDNNPTETPDASGFDVVTPPNDSGGKDSGGSETSVDAGPGPLLNLIHAMPGETTIRLCFQVAGTFPLQFPLPPDGLPPAAGGQLLVPKEIAPAIPNVAIQPYIIRGNPSSTTTCDSLVNLDAGGAGSVVPLTQLPAGTVKSGHSYLIALMGCAKDAANSPAKCGSDYDGGASTLRAVAIEVDSAPVGGNDIGVQFVHLSPEAQSFFAANSLPAVAAATHVAEAGADAGYTPVGTAVAFSPQPSRVPATAVTATGALSDPNNNTFGVYAPVAFGASNPAAFDMSWTDISATSTGVADAAYFQKGATYTIAMVGDPTDQLSDGGFGEHILRFVALKSSQ